jgi:hypothetical protein
VEEEVVLEVLVGRVAIITTNGVGEVEAEVQVVNLLVLFRLHPT